jgi:hypothetical protein
MAVESVARRWGEPASKLLFMKPSGSWRLGFASRFWYNKPVAKLGREAQLRGGIRGRVLLSRVLAR